MVVDPSTTWFTEGDSHVLLVGPLQLRSDLTATLGTFELAIFANLEVLHALFLLTPKTHRFTSPQGLHDKRPGGCNPGGLSKGPTG